MFEAVASRTFVPLLLRAGLAAVFIYHGLEKIDPSNNYGSSWADKMVSPPAMPLQILVAWGELLGGAAIALGLFTRIAAIGLAIIMIGAIVTVTGSKGFGGYEYNLVLIILCAALALAGAGTFSLDRVIHLKTRGPASY